MSGGAGMLLYGGRLFFSSNGFEGYTLMQLEGWFRRLKFGYESLVHYILRVLLGVMVFVNLPLMCQTLSIKQLLSYALKHLPAVFCYCSLLRRVFL